MRFLLIFGFLAISVSSGNSKAATLNTGDILEIRFSTTALSCPLGPCDSLLVLPNNAGQFFTTTVTASLFNGTTLLGTDFDPNNCCIPIFRSPSSLLPLGATIDFTSIDDGTIAGVIDMSIQSGFLTWPSNPTPSLIIGHTDATGIINEGSGFQIDSSTILSPEPSTAIFLISGLLLAWFSRHLTSRVR